MIKYLLTKLGRASVMVHADLAALGPYTMTSSQIFSHLALPLSD